MLCIFNWFKDKLSLTERHRLIRQSGFDGVMLLWSDEYDSNYRDFPSLSRKAGLIVENIHLPFKNMNHLWEDNLDGEELTKIFLQNIDDCAEHEIPTVVMHSSYGEASPVNEIGLKRFDKLIERAEQRNVNIALENMCEASQLLQTAELLEYCDSPYLGFCFDSGHHNIRKSQKPECDLLTRFGHRLKALHLHDNNGITTGKYEDDMHLLPFDGNIDWSEIMKKIKDSGYSGAITLEAVNIRYEDISVEEFLCEAYKRAKKLEMLR